MSYSVICYTRSRLLEILPRKKFLREPYIVVFRGALHTTADKRRTDAERCGKISVRVERSKLT